MCKVHVHLPVEQQEPVVAAGKVHVFPPRTGAVVVVEAAVAKCKSKILLVSFYEPDVVISPIGQIYYYILFLS